MIHATEDGTTRTSAAHQTGRLKGSRDVGPLFQTAWTRGTVPSLRGEAGPKTFGARKRVSRNDGEGRPSMHAGRIRPVCYTNTSPRGATTTCRGTAKPCRGLKILGAAYIGPYRTRFNVARTHVGLRPMEATGACFEHPGKWLASIRNAADYNNAARLGARKPAGETSPLQSGFQARLPRPQRRAS